MRAKWTNLTPTEASGRRAGPRRRLWRHASLWKRFRFTVVLVVVPLLGLGALGCAGVQSILGSFNQAAKEARMVTEPILQLEASVNGAPATAIFDGAPGAMARYRTQVTNVDAQFRSLLGYADAYETARLVSARTDWYSAGGTLDRWLSLPVSQRPAAERSAHNAYVKDVVASRAQDGLAVTRSRQEGTALLVATRAKALLVSWLILLACLLGVVVTALVEWRLARAVLRPLVAVRAGLDRLGQGELSHRLVPQSYDELAVVTTAINSMAASLEQHDNEINHQARYDPLTGLGNRLLLGEQLEASLGRARDGGGRLGVLLLDLDGFKEINDTLGHRYGDELLRQIGPRLARALRPDDTMARVGGDEFAVVLSAPQPEVRGVDDTFDSVAGRLLDALGEPFVLDGVTLAVEASAGLALYPAHGTTAETLLQHADVAMYVAKREHSGHAVYDPTLDQHEPRKLRLLSQLPSAIAGGQLVLHYQPIVLLATGEVVGVEALVRWQHPDDGLLAPSEFLPLAEGCGLIHHLTSEVLRLGVEQGRRWAETGRPIRVSVNISARSLLDCDFPDHVSAALQAADLPADLLKLEVTESAIMADPARAIDVLRRVERLGVAISIDDFGTGYTSMAYLRDLPVHELKIDQSFVQRMGQSHRDAVIVQTAIELARRLGMSSVAEGVESDPIRRALEALGCDKAQGYLYSRPLPPEQFDQWLLEAAAGTSSAANQRPAD